MLKFRVDKLNATIIPDDENFDYIARYSCNLYCILFVGEGSSLQNQMLCLECDGNIYDLGWEFVEQVDEYIYHVPIGKVIHSTIARSEPDTNMVGGMYQILYNNRKRLQVMAYTGDNIGSVSLTIQYFNWNGW